MNYNISVAESFILYESRGVNCGEHAFVATKYLFFQFLSFPAVVLAQYLLTFLFVIDLCAI